MSCIDFRMGGSEVEAGIQRASCEYILLSIGPMVGVTRLNCCCNNEVRTIRLLSLLNFHSLAFWMSQSMNKPFVKITFSIRRISVKEKQDCRLQQSTEWKYKSFRMIRTTENVNETFIATSKATTSLHFLSTAAGLHCRRHRDIFLEAAYAVRKHYRSFVTLRTTHFWLSWLGFRLVSILNPASTIPCTGQTRCTDRIKI